MNPTKMAEKQMFPTHGSDSSDGEPDAVKVASPVRRGGWRKPAGAVRPSAAPSLPTHPWKRNPYGLAGVLTQLSEQVLPPPLALGTEAGPYLDDSVSIYGDFR